METKELIEKVVERINLTETESFDIFNEIFLGNLTTIHIAALLTSLRTKGETSSEIAGAAKAMRENAKNALSVPISNEIKINLVDTCGTGGDYKNTFNISTCAALIAAGAGVKIAKHGNYGVSSKSGSADVFKELGVNINADAALILRSIEEANIGFLFAPKFHSAMKFAAPVRKELGFKTIFNILGPLTNPLGAKNQLLGVYSLDLAEKMINALKILEAEHVFIVYGKDGLDEVSLSSITIVYELNNNEVTSYEFDPRDYGFNFYNIKEFQSFSPSENAAIIKDIINGKPSPKADLAILNAGFVIMASRKTNDFKEAFNLAKESVKSGNAKKALERQINISNY
jgi:anthranilate phosphoribosyltransferase